MCGEPAGYYNITYYIHICSVGCFDKFLEGYNQEIDLVAREIKTAAELFTKEEEE